MPRSKDFRAALSSRTADTRSDALSVYFPPAAPGDVRQVAGDADRARSPGGTVTRMASARHAASPVPPKPTVLAAAPLRPTPYVSITTYMAAELEEALHRAAYARGGPAQKSVIVREALQALLTELETLAEANPAGYANRLAQIRAEPRQGAVRAYLVDPTVHARLQELAALDRIPLSASVRAALRAALDGHEVRPGPSRRS